MSNLGFAAPTLPDLAATAASAANQGGALSPAASQLAQRLSQQFLNQVGTTDPGVLGSPGRTPLRASSTAGTGALSRSGVSPFATPASAAADTGFEEIDVR